MCILLHLELKFRVIQTRIISLRLRVRCEKPRNNCQTPVQCWSTKVGLSVWYLFGKYGGGKRAGGVQLRKQVGGICGGPTTPHVQYKLRESQEH